MREYPFQYTSKQYLIWSGVALLIGVLINPLLGFGIIGAIYSLMQAYLVREPYLLIRDGELIIRNSAFNITRMDLSQSMTIKQLKPELIELANQKKKIHIDLALMHYEHGKQLIKFLQELTPTANSVDFSQHLIDDFD